LEYLFLYFLGAYFDGEHKEYVLRLIVLFGVSSFWFGKSLYKELPFRFGGGQPYQISMISDNNMRQDTLSVLYENGERLLLKDSKGMIQFSLKSGINQYIIIQPQIGE
jgi:hypothetical protein